MDNKKPHIEELLRKYREGNCSKDELDMLFIYFNMGDKLRHLLKDMQGTFKENIFAQEPIAEGVSNRMKTRLLKELKFDNGIVSINKFAKWWKLSAAVVLIAVLGYWVSLNGAKEIHIDWQSVVTVPGEHKTIVLPDSSVVFLNGDSELKYPKEFEGNSRIVKLKGEAFFDIRADKKHPFYVVGKEFTTKVLGTSFNIDTDLDPSVSVATGVVQVVKISEQDSEKVLVMQEGKKDVFNLKSNDINNSWSNDNQDLYVKMKLVANEKATLDDNAGGWIKEQRINSINWSDGKMAFYNEEVGLIIKGLERYYGARISVSDAIRHCEVTLPLMNKNLDQALQLLAQLSGAAVKKNGDDWFLEGGGCGL